MKIKLFGKDTDLKKGDEIIGELFTGKPGGAFLIKRKGQIVYKNTFSTINVFPEEKRVQKALEELEERKIKREPSYVGPGGT